MSLFGPSVADETKLHNEINQCLQQRVVIATTAIAIFGVVMTWMFSVTSRELGRPSPTSQAKAEQGKEDEVIRWSLDLRRAQVTIKKQVTVASVPADSDPPDVQLVFVLIACLLLVLLLVLSMVSHSISRSIRVISTYLRHTGKSGWEEDYRSFAAKVRTLNFVGQEEAHTLLFLVLGGLVLVATGLLAYLSKLQKWYCGSWVMFIVLWLLYMGWVVWVYISGRKRSFDEWAQARWSAIDGGSPWPTTTTHPKPDERANNLSKSPEAGDVATVSGACEEKE